MRSIKVMLLEGFADDEVVVSVDGLEVERRSAVSTSLLLGLADAMILTVADDAAELEVALPPRGSFVSVPLPAGDSTFLANIEAGELGLVQGTGLEGAM